MMKKVVTGYDHDSDDNSNNCLPMILAIKSFDHDNMLATTTPPTKA